jgi:hypothetical protein
MCQSCYFCGTPLPCTTLHCEVSDHTEAIDEKDVGERHIICPNCHLVNTVTIFTNAGCY